ncbi:MAG: Glu-tRNA(Gln) amidotransferase subunit GatE [Candidatus Hermodarchaeota archaeon]
MSSFNLDYEKLGFKAGIEIHAQLNTKKKLFCSCPTLLRTDEPQYYIKRKHRPVLGEMGKFDTALLIEFEKAHTIVYEGYDTICTYELDETPPFPMSQEALEMAMSVGMLLKCEILPEVHVCRKNYLDGSVTSGFQLTALLGVNGSIPMIIGDKIRKEVPISYIYIEEDAARKDSERTKDKTIFFRLDRLGFPLIEIVTYHNMNTPEEVVTIAKQLGMILKSAGKTRRGLGAIRQDINVSIKEGSRVELKGISQLDLITLSINMEIQRQQNLVQVKKELISRGLMLENLSLEPVDITSILKDNKSFIGKGIKKGDQLIAVLLPKFKGILGTEIQPNRRVGTEVADRIKSYTSLKGIIHSDEKLSKYKIDDKTLETIESKLKLKELDAFFMVLGSKREVNRAVEFGIERIKTLLNGVPEETRQVKEDGTSVFMRDLHGKSRIYPDTDSNLVYISDEQKSRIQGELPPLPWEEIERLKKKYELSTDIAEEVLYEGYSQILDACIQEGVDPKLVVNTLLQTFVALRRKGIPVENITDEHLIRLFYNYQKGNFAKEAIPELLEAIAKEPSKEADITIKEKTGQDASIEDLNKFIANLLDESKEFIAERGEEALGGLMGSVMKEFRGKIDGKTINMRLREALLKHLKKN